ncbi:AAA family ATPase [Luteibacter anthropi]|uniref:ExeA family protein n=1 Tax=Luteibacter anthropi TaxID=564369 RepID=UPI0020324ADB|nr:AAA family ATPase [Luteibacter anthropi]URX63281.1 AAA family ATPase [Luteibacter anthropi]
MNHPGRPIENQCTPLQLHGLLRRHRISQSELCKVITYSEGPRAGQPIAHSTVSWLILRQEMPRSVNIEALKEQVCTFLRSRNVPEAEIATAFCHEGSTEELFPSARPRAERVSQPIERDIADDTIQLPEAEMLSQSAREHFHLSRHPFQDDVQGPQDVYLSTDQRYVRESMYYAAKHGGFVAVVGESGSGKSTLRRDLIDRIHRENEPIIIIQPQTIDKRQLTAAHICDAIIGDLSTETPKLSLEAKSRQIQRILAASARNGMSHVLMIEEAHDLSIPTLKYLKRFWEMEDGFRRLLSIVLVGQPELGDRLDERRNPDAREVIRRCEIARLKPLNGNLEDYLTLKFKRVGVKLTDVFEADAFDAMRTRVTRRRPGTNEIECQLYPLVVHNLIVRAMNQVVELGLDKVSGELIGRI